MGTVPTFILGLLCGFGCLCPCVLSASVCPHITHVVILVEVGTTGPGNDANNAFELHQQTALSFVQRLPMMQEGVRVTVLQFSDTLTEVVVVGDQNKVDALERIRKIAPFGRTNAPQSGGLLGVMERVSSDIVPSLAISQTQSSMSKSYPGIVLVTILSSSRIIPDATRLVAVFQNLARQGVMSYVIAYNMNGRPSVSVLYQVVSKSKFLILPFHTQAETSAAHLSNILEVCWPDSPCWPNNPCYHQCECKLNPALATGYECVSSGSEWLGSNCTRPALSLSCLSDRVEVRLPKTYVTDSKNPPGDSVVFIGQNYRLDGSQQSSSDCFSRTITSPSQDPGITRQASAMLALQGYYYLISASIIRNHCSFIYRTSEGDGKILVENVIKKTKQQLPTGVRMDTPLLHLSCEYDTNLTRVHSLQPSQHRAAFSSLVGKSGSNRNPNTHESPVGRSFTEKEKPPPPPTKPQPPTTAPAAVPTTAFDRQLQLKLYSDRALSQEITSWRPPVGTKVFLSVSFSPGQSSTSKLCPVLQDCWLVRRKSSSASQTVPAATDVEVRILDRGCIVKDNVANVEILHNGESDSAIMSLHAIQWKGSEFTRTAVWIRCKARICDCGFLPCKPDCGSIHSRRRRFSYDIDDVADYHVYSPVMIIE